MVYTLIFNTAPVAFGALGAPVTTLGAGLVALLVVAVLALLPFRRRRGR